MTQPGPNPQTNLIFSIVAPVVGLIAVAVIYFTKPVPVAPAAPAPVNIAPAKLPANTVVMANALPNAGSGTAGTAGGSGMPGAPGGSGQQLRGSNKGKAGGFGAN
jgi:hypothetical protein